MRPNYDKINQRAIEMNEYIYIGHGFGKTNSKLSAPPPNPKAIEMASINVMPWKILLNVTNRSIVQSFGPNARTAWPALMSRRSMAVGSVLKRDRGESVRTLCAPATPRTD